MKNPSIKTVPVGDTPTLIFHGTGNVNVTGFSGDSFAIGNEDLASSGDSAHGLNSPMPFEFNAPAKIYACCAPGQSGVALVMNWF